MWEAPVNATVLDLKRHGKIQIPKLSACKLSAGRKASLSECKQGQWKSPYLEISACKKRSGSLRALEKCKPQCPLWAQAYLGDYYPCLLPPKQFTCDSNGRFFFFKCLKERPDSLEATGLYLKETVWHLQGKGHFFTPLKRIDNNNRKNIQQEELHFPRPPGETVTQLWDWFYEPVH